MSNRAPHLSAAERRDQAAQAVIDLAAVQSPAEITTTDIARRVGLTQAALFRHFPTKNAILQSTMNWVSARLMTRVDREVAQASSPVAALEAVFLAHVDLVAHHPGLPRVLFGELQRAEPTPARQAAQTLLRDYGAKLEQIITLGKEAGEFGRDTDEKTAAALFIGTIQGLVMQAMISGEVEQMRRTAPPAFALYRQALGIRPDV